MQRLIGFWLVLLLVACEGGQLSPSQAVDATAFSTLEGAARPQGHWLAGDLHVHSDHSADGSAMRQGFDQRGPGNVSVADQIGQGVLNGLAWLPITDHRTYVQHYDPLWDSAELLLIEGEEANGSPHANPLGAVDTITQGGVPDGRPAWSRLQTSIWDAHSQGAAWSHNHPDSGHLNPDLTPNENANALGADVVEAWNAYAGIEREMVYAENRWNAGFRFGIVGASDNHFRELWPIAGPGLPATRVFAPQATVRGVIQGLRAGRTLINAGERRAAKLDLVGDFDADPEFEVLAGDEVVVAPGTTARLKLSVSNALPSSRLHLYTPPGRSQGPQYQFEVTASEQSFEFSFETPAQPSWYYAELRGPGEPHSLDFDARDDPERLSLDQVFIDERRAISSPIFVGPRLAVPVTAQALPAELELADDAQRVLGAQGQFAGFPDLAVVGQSIHLVAEMHTPGATGVYYTRKDATGLASTINLAPGSASARFPKIAAQGQRVWVVWQDERASQRPRRPAIYARQSSDGGLNWQPEILVRSLDGRAERPDLALLGDAWPVVVWQEIGPNRAFDVMVQRLGVDAAPRNLSGEDKVIAAPNAYDTRSARYPASVWPRVAVGSEGQIAVAFSDNRNDPDPNWTGSLLVGEDGATEFDEWQIRLRVWQDGGWSAPRLLGAEQRAHRHPDLCYLADGRLLVVWDSKQARPAGVNSAIHAAFSADNGQSFSTPVALAEAPQMLSQYPRVAAQGIAGAQVVWYDNRASDWRWKIMTARFDGRWDAGKLYPAPGNNTWPAIDQGHIAFASTRDARRLQRDLTQQIYLLTP